MAAWSLADRVILITGGARGIGAATARELARRGARPALADLDAEALGATAAAISPSPLTIELDVTDADACAAAVQRVLDAHGRLDVVWANAGIASLGPLQLTDPRAWARTVEVNLLGAYHTVRAALPALISQRGYVAVTASLASFAHPPHMSAYAATKAAVEAMSNSLRIEVAHHGVDVGTIHPTWFDTDMVREYEGSIALIPDPARLVTAAVPEDVSRRARGAGHRRRIRAAPATDLHATVRVGRAGAAPVADDPPDRGVERTVAPEMERVWRQDVADRGLAASVSERIAAQVSRGDAVDDAGRPSASGGGG